MSQHTSPRCQTHCVEPTSPAFLPLCRQPTGRLRDRAGCGLVSGSLATQVGPGSACGYVSLRILVCGPGEHGNRVSSSVSWMPFRLCQWPRVRRGPVWSSRAALPVPCQPGPTPTQPESCGKPRQELQLLREKPARRVPRRIVSILLASPCPRGAVGGANPTSLPSGKLRGPVALKVDSRRAAVQLDSASCRALTGTLGRRWRAGARGAGG